MCSVNGSDYCLSHTKKSLPRRNSKINQYCSDCSDKETAFSSVTQSCPILCDPMDRSMPGLPVHHQLPKLAQIHVGDAHPTISSFVVPFSSRLQSFPASGSFPMTQLLTGEGNGNPLQYSCLENPMDGGAW